MQNKTTTKLQGNDKTQIKFAKDLVRHLEKIGQIPGKATDQEIEEMYWKIKNENKTSQKLYPKAQEGLIKYLKKIGQIK